MKTKHIRIITLASCILLAVIVLPGAAGCRRQTVTLSMLTGGTLTVAPNGAEILQTPLK